MKRLVILGATGSIGTQTLDVVRTCPDRFAVHGLSAHGRWQALFSQAQEFRPRRIAVTDDSLRGVVGTNYMPTDCELGWGQAAVDSMVSDPNVDMVVAAMVGAAGLHGAVRALEAGKDLALANKETLVVGGALVTALAKRNGCRLLPVDSEHSAVFQCLQGNRATEVARIVLTASGGPFRTRLLADFPSITIEEALRHPTWRMGPKITIDSATMMNKALEIIEARWLFDLTAEQIAVVVHPQSQVHSFVEFLDGSVLAQASPPDMRLPIQYALTFPERIAGPARKMDWSATTAWEFAPPDLDRYPALALGYEVARIGGTAGAALNAANETAVARFLSGEIRFVEIVRLCKEILEHHPFDSNPTLEQCLTVDRRARQEAAAWISVESSSRSSASSSAPSPVCSS